MLLFEIKPFVVVDSFGRSFLGGWFVRRSNESAVDVEAEMWPSDVTIEYRRPICPWLKLQPTKSALAVAASVEDGRR